MDGLNAVSGVRGRETATPPVAKGIHLFRFQPLGFQRPSPVTPGRSAESSALRLDQVSACERGRRCR
jgi:hypothetical protein